MSWLPIDWFDLCCLSVLLGNVELIELKKRVGQSFMGECKLGLSQMLRNSFLCYRGFYQVILESFGRCLSIDPENFYCCLKHPLDLNNEALTL